MAHCNIYLDDLKDGKDFNSDKKRKTPTDWSTAPEACKTSKNATFAYDITGSEIKDDEPCTVKKK